MQSRGCFTGAALQTALAIGRAVPSHDYEFELLFLLGAGGAFLLVQQSLAAGVAVAQRARILNLRQSNGLAVWQGRRRRLLARRERDLDCERQMKAFLGIASAYLLIALTIDFTLQGDLPLLLSRMAMVVVDFSQILAFSLSWALPVLVVLFFRLDRAEFRQRVIAVLYAYAGCILLQTAFFFMKHAIPSVVPFYADPALAGFDQWLHGGTDPWVIAHRWAANINMGLLLPFYTDVWVLPATSLPIFLTLLDRDPGRRARFLALFLGVWILLGNVVAVAVSSAGPVFYDALLGGDRFGALSEALRLSPIDGSMVGSIQRYLWFGYKHGTYDTGVAISAFPSVHVALITVIGLYLAERSRFLAPVGMALLALFQFLSVYTGYHYAIDGYFSALAVFAGWGLLRSILPKTVALGRDGEGGLPHSSG